MTMMCLVCGAELRCMEGGGCMMDFDCPKCNPGSFTEKGSVTNELVKRYDDKLQEIMNQKWTVGAMDRGMGRYSFAGIIGESGESFIEVKHMCQREIVEHLVELHNEWLKSQVTDQVI